MSGELFLIYWAIGVAVFTSQLGSHWWMVDTIFDMLDKEHGEESPPALRLIAIMIAIAFGSLAWPLLMFQGRR